MGKFIDITGQVFGKLTVLERVEDKLYSKKKRVKWLCQCSCEDKTLVVVDSSNLKSGGTQSCGCFKRDNPSRLNHGMAYSNENRIWRDMKNRCENKKNKYYHNYGGRGIKVCDEWINSFEKFYEDMGNRPGPEYSIDRIDNNGNYCKENCRWTTIDKQNKNRRSTKLNEEDANEIRKKKDINVKELMKM